MGLSFRSQFICQACTVTVPPPPRSSSNTSSTCTDSLSARHERHGAFQQGWNTKTYGARSLVTSGVIRSHKGSSRTLQTVCGVRATGTSSIRASEGLSAGMVPVVLAVRCCSRRPIWLSKPNRWSHTGYGCCKPHRSWYLRKYVRMSLVTYIPYVRKWLALEHRWRRNGFNSHADFTHRLLLPVKVRHVSNISFGHCKTNRYPKRRFAKTNSRSHRQAGDGEPKRTGAEDFTYVCTFVCMFIRTYVRMVFGGVRLRPFGRRT